MNAMFTFFGQDLCEKCADKDLANRKGGKVPPGALGRLEDPTICIRCQRDGGSVEFPKVGGHPVCHDCEEFYRQRPFPTWLRGAFGGLALLAVASLILNQRFLSGYLRLVQSARAGRQGNLQLAGESLEEAARLVPEDAGLKAMASYLRGAYLVQQDRSQEAIPLLTNAKAGLPGNASVERLLFSAQMGAAFDAKDYGRLLARSQEYVKRFPQDPFAEGSLASAYACEYAVAGREESKAQALLHLERAAKLAKDDPDSFKEYEERIRYRLESREIISQDEYRKRFPHGRTR